MAKYMEHQPDKKKEVGVNWDFLHDLLKLLRVVVPSWTSQECLLLVLHTTFLFTRTGLSILVAKLDGVFCRVTSTCAGGLWAYVPFQRLATL